MSTQKQKEELIRTSINPQGSQSPQNIVVRNSKTETHAEEAKPDHMYLLIKNLSRETLPEQVKCLFPTLTSISEIIIVKNTSNVYVKFSDVKQAEPLLAKWSKESFKHHGRKLDISLVSKLPLDLNEISRIVLMTIYQEKVDINVENVHQMFREFGVIRKIIIFKKKNYQELIEFDCSDGAYFFKQALHNVNYKDLLFLKIQFTSKIELVVNSNNSTHEWDFSELKIEKSNSGQTDGKGVNRSRLNTYPQKNDSLHNFELKESYSDRFYQELETHSLKNDQLTKAKPYQIQTQQTRNGFSTNMKSGPKEFQPCSQFKQTQFLSSVKCNAEFDKTAKKEDIIGSLRQLEIFYDPSDYLQTHKNTLNSLPSNAHNKLPMARKTFDIFVTGLFKNVKQMHLFNLFGIFGKVESVSLN